MALSILDGNQSATTLSTILSSGQHITAHTVVSLGTQAITDMRGAVSGSVVSISNLPSTQTIVGTVTANVQPQQSDDTDPNIKFVPIGFAQSDSGGQLDLWTGVKQTNPLPVYFPSTYPLPAGTNRIGVVTIGGGAVTIGAGTAQIGSVTASLAYSQTATTIASTAVTAIPVVFPTSGAYGGSLQGYNGTNTYIYSGIQAIGGTSLASATSLPVSLGSLPALIAGTAQIGSVTASISGTVPISISSVTVGNSVTIGSLPAISGTVTANVVGTNTTAQIPLNMAYNDETFTNGNRLAVSIVNSQGEEYVTPLPISGTVTANSSNGSLTTRFGSVTTANTAFATSAVTNANRKYLLIQNITTASNVITVGIGFTPTTTQGIQLFAGAGLTFEGSYIPTGAVNLLSSVTASCYTILEA